MSNKTCPCNGCVPPERYPGCGGKCSKYKDWKTSQLLEKAVKDAARLSEKICDDYAIQESIKNAKIRRDLEKFR